MKRRLDQISDHSFDLLVIGGGISGAWAAWDASLRGLSVCLLEKGDFGAATSANSLKIIHGGFRYLQRADLGRVRQSIYERAAWLRAAPHLVRPLPSLIPLGGGLTRSRPALAAALGLYNLLCSGQRRPLAQGQTLPLARLISASQCREMLGGLELPGPGAAMWYDAQALDTERLNISLVLGAAQQGAQVANYAEVTSLLARGNRIDGARAVDLTSGREFMVRARVVLNAAGPWIYGLLARAGLGRWLGDLGPMQAMGFNLVLQRPWGQATLGIETRGPGASHSLFGTRRFLFLSPWQGRTLLGTAYLLHQGRPDRARLKMADIKALLQEANRACPGLEASLDQVSFFHFGVQPLDRAERPRGLAENFRVIDHQMDQGVAGLISLKGVKYTTSRALAQQAVTLALGKLGQRTRPCATAHTPLPGGQPNGLSGPAPNGISLEAWLRLIKRYGSQAGQVAALAQDWPQGLEPVAPDCPLLGVEVRRAVSQEMALSLSDLVLRRSGLGAAECPQPEVLKACAQLMGQELGWDQARQDQEVDQVLAAYEPLTCGVQA